MESATAQQTPSVLHNTFVIERSYSKSPEKVFAAFASADKKQQWFAQGDNHDIEHFEMDFRVGGVERFSYRFKEGSPFPGFTISNEGGFEDIVPNRRIVMASTMTFVGQRISTSLVTIELLPSEKGTDLICTHQGAFYEGSDSPQVREAGWQTVLDRLSAELSNS